MLTIAGALKQSALLSSVSDSARLDTEVMLAAVLQKSRTYLYTWPDKVLHASESERFNDLMQQRQLGHPVAYILGEREFWSLTLAVNSNGKTSMEHYGSRLFPGSVSFGGAQPTISPAR